MVKSEYQVLNVTDLQSGDNGMICTACKHMPVDLARRADKTVP